jgi:hypothetical protein
VEELLVVLEGVVRLQGLREKVLLEVLGLGGVLEEGGREGHKQDLMAVEEEVVEEV